MLAYGTFLDIPIINLGNERTWSPMILYMVGICFGVIIWKNENKHRNWSPMHTLWSDRILSNNVFFFLSLLSIKCRLFAFFVSWINFSLSLVSMLAVIKQNNSWRNVLRTNLTFQQRKWLNINQCWWTAAQINSVPFIKCGTTVVFYNNEHIVLFVTPCFLDTNTKTLCINYHDECNILHAYFY